MLVALGLIDDDNGCRQCSISFFPLPCLVPLFQLQRCGLVIFKGEVLGVLECS